MIGKPQETPATILCIDDDQAVLNSYKHFLEDYNFHVLDAATAEQGLESFIIHQPDAVLLDLRMPGMHGLDALARIRAIDAHIPVIVISGTGKINDVIEALHQGATDFLLKPIENLNVLLHTIDKALENVRLRRENLEYQKTLEKKVAQRTQALEQAYELLAQSEKKYRLIFENLQDAYFESLLDGTVLEISPSVETFLRYKPEELRQADISKIYKNPPTRQMMIATLQQQGQITDYELEMIAADGNPVYCSLNATLLTPENGQPPRISGAFRDISQRKQAEKELRASKQTLEGLFEAAPLAILAVDTEFRITLWNSAAEKTFGWRAAEVLGRPYPLGIPGKEAEVKRNLQQAISGNQFNGLELVRQRKDGKLIEISLSTAPLRNSDGQINGLILIMDDISEKRQLRNEAERASRLASLGELAAGVAHEINNPNGLIMLNLPTLRDFVSDALALQQQLLHEQPDLRLGGLSPTRAAEAFPQLLTEIEDGSRRIKQIVEDLKDFARQGETLSEESFDLNESTQKSLRLAANHLKKSTASIRQQLADDLPRLNGSAQRIEQVIVNLLVNACEALTDRSQEISIETGHHAENNEVFLCIRDQGCGISAEQLPHVTDPFFTTRRDRGGTGLGLSVSARIIKEHRGRLKLESEPGAGTSAWIYLPVDDKE